MSKKLAEPRQDITGGREEGTAAKRGNAHRGTSKPEQEVTRHSKESGTSTEGAQERRQEKGRQREGTRNASQKRTKAKHCSIRTSGARRKPLELARGESSGKTATGASRVS